MGVCAMRENAVGVHCRMDAWVWVDITSVRTSFYNFVCTGNLFNLREGGEEGKRKQDHKVCEVERQNNRGRSGTLM
jgi:hypothetical protein